MTRDQFIVARNIENKRKHREECMDRSVGRAGRGRRERTGLGLALLHVYALPGVCYTYTEIAAWAGCTDSNIKAIEKSALRKVRQAFPELEEFCGFDAGRRDALRIGQAGRRAA